MYEHVTRSYFMVQLGKDDLQYSWENGILDHDREWQEKVKGMKRKKLQDKKWAHIKLRGKAIDVKILGKRMHEMKGEPRSER
jgi:hypothetical protein